jgi:hypothetical protein
MSDNTTLNAMTGGDTIAADDIAGVKHQRVKVEFGADGAASDVETGNPLPVTVIALPASPLPVSLSSTRTPSWTDGVTIVSPQMLARGAVLTATINLTGKPGMRALIGVGRSGATAIDVGIGIHVHRTVALSPIVEAVGAPDFTAICDTAASVSGVCAAAGNNAGVASLTLNAAKTFVAGTNGIKLLSVIDNTTTPTTASEFLVEEFATSTTVKLLRTATISAHNSTAHVVSDRANMFMAWLEGGCINRIVISYGAATTGDAAFVYAVAQTLNSEVTV